MADDVMEPFRPLVDMKVYKILDQWKFNFELNLDKNTKPLMLEILAEKIFYNDKKYPLMVAIANFINSIRNVMEEKDKHIEVPTF